MKEDEIFKHLEAIYHAYNHNMLKTRDLPLKLRKLADDIEKD